MLDFSSSSDVTVFDKEEESEVKVDTKKLFGLKFK